jgi:hypothetical protein
MQAAGALGSAPINCDTVATVPSKTKMTKTLVFTYKTMPQIVGRKLPGAPRLFRDGGDRRD